MRHGYILNRLIEHLRTHPEFSGSTCVAEFKIGKESTRADLAVFGASIHGFEIKSEFDTTRRLESQLYQYLKFFDHTTIICHPKHSAKVISIADLHVGIWEFTESDAFRVIRPSITSPFIDNSVLISPLWRSELMREVEKSPEKSLVGTKSNKDLLREIVLNNLGLSELKHLLRTSIATRSYSEKSRLVRL